MWGPETQIRTHSARYDQPMLSLLYLVVRAIVRLLVSAGQPRRAYGSKDLEILVLRHQLRVLQRTSGPLKLRAIGRPTSSSRGRDANGGWSLG